MIEMSIKKLVQYGRTTGLIEAEDEIYARNQILEVLKMSEYEEPGEITDEISLEDTLNALTAYAAEQGILENNSVVYRDLFDTRLMNCLMPRPSEVVKKFHGEYEKSPEDATAYFYKLSQDSDYIRRYRVCKDLKWITKTEYGDLDITTITDKPKARQEVATSIISEGRYDDMLDYIGREVRAGKQAYFVCSKIDEDDEEGTLISVKELYEELKARLPFVRFALLHGKMKDKEKAEISAKLYADASRDGVYTHGLNRFPKFIKSIHDGIVDIHAEPVLKESFGAFERYDGCHGPGNLNAYACTKRAIELAKQNTIGCVALANTNHWMRPGNYGLMAVEQNCIGIFWTNTVPNMPPWGGRDARLGNNPITLAIPHGDTPVLVDVAMSMFSYGKLEVYKRSGRPLPVDGGLNKDQQPTRNAAEILETHESYPIGYWKGSGLSLALDLIAAALAGGRTTRQVGELPLETELSQVFICIDLDSLPDKENIAANVEASLRDMETSTPVEEGRPVHFPGAHMAEVRSDNMENGIPVEEAIWQQVLAL